MIALDKTRLIGRLLLDQASTACAAPSLHGGDLLQTNR